MSFERPERILTKEEWSILSEAAQDKAGDYNVLSGKVLSGGQDMNLANFYARKANRIFKVLIDLENEYYEAHPEEDPDKTDDCKTSLINHDTGFTQTDAELGLLFGKYNN